MPRLKEVHAQWEDRWWPQPMQRGERAAPTPFRPVAQPAAD
jgi:hypothetical protein